MFSILLVASVLQQGHNIEPQQNPMKHLAFMKGEWVGKQEFDTGGEPMVGDATNKVAFAIGGRYLEERLSTTFPGRESTDARHMVTFDPLSQTYKAWWFNDTSVGPTEFEGKLEGGGLVLLSKPTGPRKAILRATYSSPSKDQLLFKLEMKNDDEWMLLFVSKYNR